MGFVAQRIFIVLMFFSTHFGHIFIFYIFQCIKLVWSHQYANMRKLFLQLNNDYGKITP